MKRTGLGWGGVAAVIIVTVSCSKGEGPKRASEQPPERPVAVGTGGAAGDVKNDAEFVHDVAIMNMAEVELSRTALQHATNGDIKSFAQRMIDEHNAAGNALKNVVSGQSIAWPSQLDEKRQKIADELAKEQGTDFDRHYAKDMVEGHENLAAILESRLDVQSLAEWKTAAAGRAQSKTLPDPKVAMTDVKVRPNPGGNEITKRINQWAADTYPVVQKHLDSARALENAMKTITNH